MKIPFLSTIAYAAREALFLIYPPTCVYCSRLLSTAEHTICLTCEFELAYTHFWTSAENPFTELFASKCSLVHAASFFHFIDGGISQAVLHELKYNSNPKIGVILGERFGYKLINSEFYTTIDVIVPVPLHKKRFRERGYNQSEQIAIGLSKAMNLPIDTNTLQRPIYNLTQTKKNKAERETNVLGIFALNNPEVLEGKHVLLVDDVLTTGATLIACAELILQIPNVKLSIVTLAKA